MTDEIKPKKVLRHPNGNWKKGTPPPNPKGRPKGWRLGDLIREVLEEGKGKITIERLVRVILKMAIIEEDFQMLKLLWNYLDGLPTQAINLGGEVKLPFTFIIQKDDGTTDEPKTGEILPQAI